MTSSSLPLFDDGPGKDFCLSEVLALKKPADKAQHRFRKLVANIERKRKELRQWQAYEQRYNQRVTSEFEPVRSDLPQKQRQMAVLSQSLRDVFRKLVSALHPDREPDPTERVRKNQLMQRANQAYDANDLLTL